MTEIEKVKKAVLDFVAGGDNSDTVLLDKVLHKDFRVVNNGFMGSRGVTEISKAQYLDNIRTGVFGGLPRQASIESVDVSDTIAMAKIQLESSENSFISYNSLVLDTDGQWKIVSNLAVVKSKL